MEYVILKANDNNNYNINNCYFNVFCIKNFKYFFKTACVTYPSILIVCINQEIYNISPILHSKKLRLRKVKTITQDHTDNMEEAGNQITTY